MSGRTVLAILAGLSATMVAPATARADLCPYPGIGVGAEVLFGRGGFCDYPTEINGSHMHCEAGGAGLGGSGGLTAIGDMGTATLGLGGIGFGGASCTWRCPDGTMAPAPNPPGLWKDYIVPMNSTNFCFLEGHMEPNGHWSAPVLPTEGVPPEGFQPPAAVAPGEPAALEPEVPNA